MLVDGHDPVAWARVRDLIGSPARLAELSRGALAHASGFGWPATADRLIEVYTGAMDSAWFCCLSWFCWFAGCACAA